MLPSIHLHQIGDTEQTSEVQTGEFKVVCCYCQGTMEVKKVQGASSVSHGICYSCFIKAREMWRHELEAYQRKWAKKQPTPQES